MDDTVDIRSALCQQLATDALLGLTFVPIPGARWPDAAARSAEASPGAPPRESRRGAGSVIRGSQRASSVAVTVPDIPRPDPIPTARKIETLRVLDETKVKSCRLCSLHETRTQTVFGQGNPDARLVFVGEAPGYEEDKQGLAFVGRAGELLTRMIGAMGLNRDEVYICNVLKCRPPNNRDPSADEILACSPYLRTQLTTIQPEVIVALGAPAAKTLLNTVESIGRLRGRFHEYYLSGSDGVGPWVPLMPTYHPAYLLRNEGEKRKTWDDLQMVMERLGLPLPG